MKMAEGAKPLGTVQKVLPRIRLDMSVSSYFLFGEKEKLTLEDDRQPDRPSRCDNDSTCVD